jgi:DNA mismatch endonuclease (patch repair protein)
MSAIRGKDTAPELRVRRGLHALGLRYRLHRRDLPGKPDLVLPKYRAVVFVHGCFWHMHRCPFGRPKPATNTTFWEEKRSGNVARDKRNRRALEAEGWRVFVIWECETRDSRGLETALRRVHQGLLGCSR